MKMKINFWVFSFIVLGIAMIASNSCKKDDDSQTIKYTIGQSYGGGIIVFIDNSGQHGLIAAESDQSNSIQWSNGSSITTSATGILVGDGAKNTKAIVTAQGDGNYAAKLCDDLVLNGYTDWFLPSTSDLNILYSQSISGVLTGFTGYIYWSSTEKDSQNAYIHTFGPAGSEGYSPKSGGNNVRAVRAF